MRTYLLTSIDIRTDHALSTSLPSLESTELFSSLVLIWKPDALICRPLDFERIFRARTVMDQPFV